MEKPKVIFLGPLPPPYMGPTLATSILLSSQLRDQFNLIHCDTSDHRDLNNLGVIDFQNIFLALKHYVKLLFLIIKWWPSLVYIPVSQTTLGYFRDAGFILISKIFGRKIICHLRGGNFKNWYDSCHPFVQFFIRQIHSLIDGQIVLGDKLRELFAGILVEEKIFVVPNGKDIRAEFFNKSESDKKRVLFLSNFIREKGILDVMYSIPEVYKCDNEIEYIFAGNWRDENTKKIINEFLIENPHLPIKILGPVFGPNKIKLLFSSDIFVFPTYYPPEGHPWVIVEAMAAGLPIVTTDQGAVTESVINGLNGFIVDKKNPEQIADKIKLLLKNSKLRLEMGAESYRRYKEQFTEDVMISKLSNVLNSVLQEKS